MRVRIVSHFVHIVWHFLFPNYQSTFWSVFILFQEISAKQLFIGITAASFCNLSS